jgi:DNA-binding IclR family transcriptional regulator
VSEYNDYQVLKCLRATTEGALTVTEIHHATGIGSTGVRRAVKALIESDEVVALGYSSTNARCYGVKRVKE